MDQNLLLATYAWVLPQKDKFAAEFYGQLFTKSPEAHQLFIARQVDMVKQGNLLMATLFAVVTGIKDDPQETIEKIKQLGKRHQSYGALPEFYNLIGEVLIDTFKVFLKDGWTPDKEKAWREAYALIQYAMLDAYEYEHEQP